MTIKAKWDKLRFGNLSTFIWVFVEGKMFAINEAAYDKNYKDKFNNKTFYEGTNIKRDKLDLTMSRENQFRRSAI